MSCRLALLAAALSVVLLACGGATSSPSPAAPSSNAAASPAPSSSALATRSASPSTAAEAIVCSPRALKFDATKFDLTGPWLGDDDGIYYLRQLDKSLWWSGMSGLIGPASKLGREWNNVASGTIKQDLTIELNWSDVPRGQILGYGTLTWKIVNDGTGGIELKKLSETGTGFGGSLFAPCWPG
jgi:hypothetical protein